jgi:hypothetical protein
MFENMNRRLLCCWPNLESGKIVFANELQLLHNLIPFMSRSSQYVERDTCAVFCVRKFTYFWGGWRVYSVVEFRTSEIREKERNIKKYLCRWKRILVRVWDDVQISLAINIGHLVSRINGRRSDLVPWFKKR